MDNRHRKVEETMNALNDKIDDTKGQVKAEFDNTKVALMKLASDVRAEIASGAGTAPSMRTNGSTLVTLKETTVDKLPEVITKVEFDNWVEELYVHIDRANGCTGMSSLLKEIRLCTTSLTEDTMNDIIDKTHDAKNDFDKFSFDYRARDKDLYAYLLRKLNKKLKALVAGTRSGFEMFRRIMREEDPVTESTEYSLRFAFQQMVFQKSTSIEGTRKLIQAMEKKISEYREKTGKEMDEVLKTTVIHGAMDAETGREVRRNRVVLSYDKIKGFIEELYQEEQNRMYATVTEGKKPKVDAMDVGNINALNGREDPDREDWEEDTTCEDGNALDAIGKGKGKGKGSSMECYRCGGVGHPARDCPTPEDSTAKHQCFECGGKGHYGRDHRGDGKGDAVAGKGAKGGKGAYGKGPYAAKGASFYSDPYMAKGSNFFGKGGKYGAKGYGPSKGGSGKGAPRSMNSFDNAMFATMEPDTSWDEHYDWRHWENDVSTMGTPPWQEAGPWLAPRRPGGMSSMSQAVTPVQNRFQALERHGEDIEEGSFGAEHTVEMKDLIEVAQKNIQLKQMRRERKRSKKLSPSLCPFQHDSRESDCHFCPDHLCEGLSLFEAKGKGESMQINNLTDYKGWKAIEVTIDSGACDTVMPINMCKDIPVHESKRQQEGMEYEVANGETIPNEGERHCMIMTMGAVTPKNIVFQVADVHKALLSITRVADAGYECHLNKTGGYLLDTYTGERVPIHRKGNLYVMRAWVRDDEGPGFGRQGR